MRLESLIFRDRFDSLLEKRLSGVAELGYTMLYGKSQLIVLNHYKTYKPQYDPKLKFSCYDTTLGNVERKPSLGNPQPLKQELYERCRFFVDDVVGPGHLPEEWQR